MESSFHFPYLAEHAARCAAMAACLCTACGGSAWPPTVPPALPESSVSHEAIGEGQRERPVFVLDSAGVPEGLVFLGGYTTRLGDEQLRLGVCRRDASGGWTREFREVRLSEVADRDPELRLSPLAPVRATSFGELWTVHLRQNLVGATHRWLEVDIDSEQVVARQLSHREVVYILGEEREAPRLIPTSSVQRLDGSRIRRYVLPARIDHTEEVFPLFPPTHDGQIVGRHEVAFRESLLAAAFLARPRYCDPGDPCDDLALYLGVFAGAVRAREGGWSTVRIAGDAMYSAPAFIDEQTVLVAHVDREGRVTVSTVTRR